MGSGNQFGCQRGVPLLELRCRRGAGGHAPAVVLTRTRARGNRGRQRNAAVLGYACVGVVVMLEPARGPWSSGLTAPSNSKSDAWTESCKPRARIQGEET
ncbi:hypothetical protein FKP32DRAFT_1087773 [Trametes sanguinea]|nr:hypothetical protein FKP32DRAFT_1087773 [Trametes sanguinea]